VTVSNRSWRANEYGDIPATNSITVSGQDTVKDTSELSLRSTGPITINSGFTVAKLGKLTINSSPGALAKRLSGEPGKHNEPQITSAQNELGFCVSAVKRHNIVTIMYTLPSEQSVNIRIFDTRGRLIMQRSVGALKAGKYINNLLLGPICLNNIFMLELSAGSQREILKLVGDR
jgi:hypothetical protein